MTDKEKLIDLLRPLLECELAGDCSYTAKDWADHILANGVTFQKWISVTERFPENDTAVIVATDRGMVFQCLYAYDGWDLWDGYTVNITHWMPLPEPPKEDV